ncbi:MAG TPA: N-acetylmuramoyl-L-alanine amidase, partial [Novosphingobium sp.]|nr:N-acetylmuramoyl-L-alanine amidase [Novosphingobium sp.]
GSGVLRRDYVVRLQLAPAGGTLGLPRVAGPMDARLPLVVLDAGHGGHDPGAGNGPLQEKALTLALARALAERLLATGHFRVALTRADDRYLALEERSGIARQLGADLFVSIHADSADAADARGATVYTLSARGSSEEAEKIAARENGADRVSGVPLRSASASAGALLVDLSQRRSAALSAAFARDVLAAGAGRLGFRARPVQSAAFVVLKTPDVPSVLVEAGYISNAEDAARLASDAGRQAFADALARAMQAYFAERAGLAGPQ